MANPVDISSFVEHVTNASANNNLTFFIGSGISKLSNVPLWRELVGKLDTLLGNKAKSNYDSQNLLEIPQKFFLSFTNDYYQKLEDILLKPITYSPDADHIYRQILNLTPHCIITTNFDYLIEDAISKNHLFYTSVAMDKEVSEIRGGKFLLKVHGDLKHRNIVLREDDYLNFSSNFKLIETLLKSIVATDCIVFIGYSLQDYNIKFILNWAKNLLKDSHRNPYLVYGDDPILNSQDFDFYRSRGIIPIDFHAFQQDYILNKSLINSYAIKYDSVLSTLLDSKYNRELKYLKNASDLEIVEFIYSKAKPLNILQALRAKDIEFVFSPFITISDRSVSASSKCPISIVDPLIRVLSDMDSLEKSSYKLIRLITEIFRKAHILHLQGRATKNVFTFQYHPKIMNKAYLSFDYYYMESLLAISSNPTIINLKVKAFFYAQLYKFNEANEILNQIISITFNNKNYAEYFIAQMNRIWLLKNKKKYMILSPADSAFVSRYANKQEEIFNLLPSDFKKKFEFLGESLSHQTLLEDSSTFSSLLQAIDSSKANGLIEFGSFSNTGKLIDITMDYLRFTIDNHLLYEYEPQFKENINFSLSKLLQYCPSNNSSSSDDIFFNIPVPSYTFDEIDFFAIIKFISLRDLSTCINILMKNSSTLKFGHMPRILESITNLFDYGSKVKSDESSIFIEHYIGMINRCLKLMQCMQLPLSTIEFVVNHVVKDWSRSKGFDFHVWIDFLDYQLGHFKKKSFSLLNSIIDDLLMWIQCEKYDLTGHYTDDLQLQEIRFLSIFDDASLVKEKLSIVILDIIADKKRNFPLITLLHFYPFVDRTTQAEIVSLKNTSQISNFSFYVFRVSIGAGILEYSSEDLHQLKLLMNNTAREDSNTIYSLVGFWCLKGILPKIEFSSYYGIDDDFDLFFDPDRFNFDSNKISRFLQYTNHVHSVLAKNRCFRKKIKSTLLKQLSYKKTNNKDRERISNLIIKFYY